MKKLRVGVFMGGKTLEKEVSLNSGRTICDHIDTSRYEVVPIFQLFTGEIYLLPWRFLHRGKISDFEHRLPQEAQHIAWDDLKSLIDIMYIATHGRYAEDGTLQGLLEMLQIPYIGSKVFASALGMDKHMQKKILHNNGILVPHGFTLTPAEIDILCAAHPQDLEIKMQEYHIAFPCVVKPHKEGSSFGVSIAHDSTELQQALQHACTIYPGKKQSVLIEEKIGGMEFSCIMITDYKTNTWQALPITEVIHDNDRLLYDYEQKYMPGRATKFTPARCSAQDTQKIQETCLRATEILGITNISRIDGFLSGQGEIILIDPNTLSAMTPVSFIFTQAAQLNISHAQLINHLIETELHNYNMLSPLLENERKEIAYMNKKIRVGVLLGGRSNEKEISLESGRNIFYKLSPQKYETIPLFLSDSLEIYHIPQKLLVLNSTKEIELKIDQAVKIQWAELPSLIDFVFIGLHGGEGENGTIQGALEILNIPYNGSGVLTSALCMDKFKTTQFLKAEGFDVPHALLISKAEWQTSQHEVLTKIAGAFKQFPLIIKPHDDGCSVMVNKVHDNVQASLVLDDIFLHAKEYALVEEFVQGMELTVGVMGNEEPRALPPSQAIAAQGILSIEEKFLPGAGENQTPAPLPSHAITLVQKTMEQVFKTINAKGYVRIDCFYQSAEQSPTQKERVVILEINTLPGLTPATCIFHQAAEIGIKAMDFLDMIIAFGFEEHGKNDHNNMCNQSKTQKEKS